MLHFAGETKKTVKHIEGDVWVENGKTWTIKKGIKRTINKLEETRKYFVAPLVCPCCSRSMKHHFNEQTWDTHRMCFECVIDLEHELMKQGKYDEYIAKRKQSNRVSFNKDLIDQLVEFMTDDVGKKHVTESGEIETWVGEDKKKVSSMINEYIDKLKENIKDDSTTH